MLTHDDADRAMQVVRDKYSAYYNKNLDIHDAKDIFIFLNEPEFATKFEITYNGCFKAANGFTKPAGAFVSGVNAFVASDLYNFQRRIYIKKIEAITWGTCVHEYIHFLSHRDFYPTFYERGGGAPDIVEGFTEYLTRIADPELMKTRTSYEQLFLKTKSWVGSSGENLPMLLGTLFGGKPSPMAHLT